MSEMLAMFLASTPLLSESWRLCNISNSSTSRGFLVEQIGDVGYIAFSGIQTVGNSEPSCRNFVPLMLQTIIPWNIVWYIWLVVSHGVGASVRVGQYFMDISNNEFYSTQMPELDNKLICANRNGQLLLWARIYNIILLSIWWLRNWCNSHERYIILKIFTFYLQAMM